MRIERATVRCQARCQEKGGGQQRARDQQPAGQQKRADRNGRAGSQLRVCRQEQASDQPRTSGQLFARAQKRAGGQPPARKTSTPATSGTAPAKCTPVATPAIKCSPVGNSKPAASRTLVTKNVRPWPRARRRPTTGQKTPERRPPAVRHQLSAWPWLIDGQATTARRRSAATQYPTAN